MGIDRCRKDDSQSLTGTNVGAPNIHRSEEALPAPPTLMSPFTVYAGPHVPRHDFLIPFLYSIETRKTDSKSCLFLFWSIFSPSFLWLWFTVDLQW